MKPRLKFGWINGSPLFIVTNNLEIPILTITTFLGCHEEAVLMMRNKDGEIRVAVIKHGCEAKPT